MKRTINSSPDIESCIRSINQALPALKSSEIIGYSYKDMGQDFKNNSIDVDIWDHLVTLKFNDVPEKASATRGCYLDDDDFSIIAENYLKQPGMKTVSLARLTRLVLYYERLKQAQRQTNLSEISEEQPDGVELLRELTETAVRLIREGESEKITEFLLENKQETPIGGIKMNQNEGNLTVKSNFVDRISKPYDSSVFVGLNTLLFPQTPEMANPMVEKALDRPLYAETWLFLICVYTTLLRPSEICQAFNGPTLLYGQDIDIEFPSLKEDILHDRITKEKYLQIADYVINKINSTPFFCSKTQTVSEASPIIVLNDDKKVILGKILLICAWHQFDSNQGVMKETRFPLYCSSAHGGRLFGDIFIEWFGRKLSPQRIRHTRKKAQFILANTPVIWPTGF